MADQTVAQTPAHFTYQDAREDLRKIGQAMAVMRSVSLAVAAQQDGAVRFKEDGCKRWQPAIDVACDLVKSVRDSITHKVGAPSDVDWWTPLTLIEAMGAALWHSNIGSSKEELSDEEFLGCVDTACASLGTMYEEIRAEADKLKQGAKAEGVTA